MHQNRVDLALAWTHGVPLVKKKVTLQMNINNNSINNSNRSNKSISEALGSLYLFYFCSKIYGYSMDGMTSMNIPIRSGLSILYNEKQPKANLHICPNTFTLTHDFTTPPPFFNPYNSPVTRKIPNQNRQNTNPSSLDVRLEKSSIAFSQTSQLE